MSRRRALDQLTESARTRRTQLITLLSHIFPIEPVDSTSTKHASSDLLFSIVGLPLPNSSFPSSYADDLLSSALGYAAQVTQLLAAYLSVPLCYPIQCRGSRSVVFDEISMMKGPRAFPLYGKGVDQYRFDYGVFLLNKNIEQVCYVLFLRLARTESSVMFRSSCTRNTSPSSTCATRCRTSRPSSSACRMTPRTPTTATRLCCRAGRSQRARRRGRSQFSLR